MQKKVLIPLMMLGPTALPVLADVMLPLPVESDSWEKSGIQGTAWFLKETNQFYTQVGGQYVKGVLTGIPNGKYTIRFDAYNNIKVYVDGKLVLTESGQGSDPVETEPFEVTGVPDQEIEIKIEGASEAMAFSFTAGQLVLKFSENQYNDINNAYESALGITLTDVNADDDFEEAVILRAKKAELENELSEYKGTPIETVLENIDKIAQGNGKFDDLKGYYSEYGLDQDPPAIEEYLNNLKEEIEKYNSEVEDENDIWVLYTENVATRETLLSEQKTLYDAAKQLLSDLEPYPVIEYDKKVLAHAQELVEALEVYRTEIEEAYPDPTGENRRELRKEIKFDSQILNLTKKYDTVKSEVENFQKDFKAWNDNSNEIANLFEAYEKYVAALEAAKGIVGYTEVYVDISADGFVLDEENNEKLLSKSGAETLYNDTRAENEIGEINGAAAVYEEKKAAIEAVIVELNADTESLENLVKDQNEKMTEASANLKEYKAYLEEKEAIKELPLYKEMSETLRTDLDNRLDAVSSAIDAFEKYIDEKYQDHVLDITAAEFGELTADYVTAKEELDKFLTPFQDIYDLLDKLETAKDKVESLEDIKLDDDHTLDVGDRFNSTYVGLKNAILALTLDQAQDSEIVKPIEDAIDEYLENANIYRENFIKAKDIIDGFVKDFTDLKDNITDKIFNEWNDIENVDLVNLKNKYTTESEGFYSKIVEYKNDLIQAAIDENDQDSWDDVVALLDKLDESTLADEISNASKEFAKKGTEFNMAFANTQLENFLEDLRKAVEDNVTNADQIDTTDIKAEFSALDSDVNSKEDGTEVEVFTDLDTRILAALYNLKAEIETLQKYQDNQDNYDDLKALADTLVPSLDELRAYNERTSMTPGKEYFVDKVFPGIQESIDALVKDLDDARDKIEIATDDQKKAFEDKIKGIEAEIASTKTDIDDNNEYHNRLLELKITEHEHINDLLEAIQKAAKDDNSAEIIENFGWVETLENLLNNDLIDANIAVTDAYGRGDAKKEYDELMQLYDDIHEKHDKIQTEFDGNVYKDAIADANADITQNWDSIISGLWNTWKQAIRNFNYFYYDLTNKGWSDFIHEAISRHENEFEYYELIAALVRDEKAFVDSENEDKHVITDEDWQTWLDKAKAIESEINAKVDAMLDEADTLANEYYDKRHTEADDAITDAENKLQSAGIDPTTYLEVAKGWLNSAEILYANPISKPHVSRDMNDIANDLDEVFAHIDLQTICEDAWTKKYDAFIVAKDALREELNGYDFASDEVKEAASDYFDLQVETAAGLNGEVLAIKSDLIDVIGEYNSNLDAILENLENIVGEVKASNDANVENRQIYDDFTGIWAPDLKDRFDALKQFCDELGGSGAMESTLSTIGLSITTLEEFVETHKGSLREHDIKGQCDRIVNAIENAYNSAMDAEISYLFGLRRTAEIAFNDAVVNCGNTLDEKLKELGSDYTAYSINRAIQRIYDDINGLPGLKDDTEEFKTAARGYEDELCNIYNLLQSTWTDSPASAVKAELDKRYDEIAEAIESGIEYLDGCEDSVREQFDGKYAGLKSSLDSEQASWQANGPEVIAHKDAYLRHLAAIEAQVKSLGEEIKAAQEAALAQAEKERVNNEMYARLSDELYALQTKLDEVQALVESYENGIEEAYLGRHDLLQGQIDRAKAALEAAHDNIELTADSELLYPSLSADIDQYKLDATRSYTGVLIGEAYNSGLDAQNRLSTLHIVPEERTRLQEQFSDCVYRYNDISSKYRTADFDSLNEIIEEAKTLKEEFDAIANGCVENSFVPGNVDMDPDGELNVIDVQMLINMVGRGETYQELYEQNPRQACAADVTGDRILNIADVTTLIDMVMGADYRSAMVAARAKVVAEDASLGISLVGEENGVRRYAVTLDNPMAFTGAELNIEVGSDSSVIGVVNGERISGHDIYTFERGEGGARLVIASLENKAFDDNAGTIFYIEVEGNGKVTVDDALFTDTNNGIHRVKAAHTSAIDKLYDNVKEFGEQIWDAAGRGMKKIQRGINIIRHSNGKVTKELHK